MASSQSRFKTSNKIFRIPKRNNANRMVTQNANSSNREEVTISDTHKTNKILNFLAARSVNFDHKDSNKTTNSSRLFAMENDNHANARDITGNMRSVDPGNQQKLDIQSNGVILCNPSQGNQGYKKLSNSSLNSYPENEFIPLTPTETQSDDEKNMSNWKKLTETNKSNGNRCLENPSERLYASRSTAETDTPILAASNDLHLKHLKTANVLKFNCENLLNQFISEFPSQHRYENMDNFLADLCDLISINATSIEYFKSYYERLNPRSIAECLWISCISMVYMARALESPQTEIGMEQIRILRSNIVGVLNFVYPLVNITRECNNSKNKTMNFNAQDGLFNPQDVISQWHRNSLQSLSWLKQYIETCFKISSQID